MRYCSNCGNQVDDNATFCTRCGNKLTGGSNVKASESDSGLVTVIKIFLIIGCVSYGFALIPLAWCIPMTLTIFNKLKRKEPIGIGLKICTLLFVNIVAGICLLCLDDNKQ